MHTLYEWIEQTKLLVQCPKNYVKEEFNHLPPAVDVMQEGSDQLDQILLKNFERLLK